MGNYIISTGTYNCPDYRVVKTFSSRAWFHKFLDKIKYTYWQEDNGSYAYLKKDKGYSVMV